jgi:formylglycine-generating enzyme required for sulfatase activity
MDSDKSVTASFNVWELCSDWYKKDYYFISPSVDPKGPSSGKYHVARGGAWGDFGYVLRCSARLEFNPGAPIYHSLYGFGFRVVRSQ